LAYLTHLCKMKAFVSIILITYNQEDWVEEAILSVLNQSYENIEIIISDDFSKDKTWLIINNITSKEEYKNKKVIVIQNKKNLGITANISQALKYASGDLIVMAAGDDVSSLNRVSTMVDQWEKFKFPSAIASSLKIIDKDGKPINNHERELMFTYKETSLLNGLNALRSHYLKKDNIKALGATLAYSRDVFETFGWDLGNNQSEDQLLLGRSLLLNGCILISEKLVEHRITGKNASYYVDENNGNKMKLGYIRNKILYSNKELIDKFKNLKMRINLLELQKKDLKEWKADDDDLILFRNEFVDHVDSNIKLLDAKINIIEKISISNYKNAIDKIGLSRMLFELVTLRCKLCNILILRIYRKIKYLKSKRVIA